MKKYLFLPYFLLILGCATSPPVQLLAEACADGDIKSYSYRHGRERLTAECK